MTSSFSGVINGRAGFVRMMTAGIVIALAGGCASAQPPVAGKGSAAGATGEKSPVLANIVPAAIANGGITAAQNIAYYRQPTIRGDVIVFLAEGDLWRVPVSGGLATRLTTQLADEAHPAISPDGKTLAYVAGYEGPAEVYTMPMEGGLPVRRTWGLTRGGFVGWTPSGQLMYSTRQFATLPSTQIVTKDLQSGTSEIVPLYEADQGAYSDNGKTLFFTRLPFQGSHTKRYKGGFIQQLWKFEQGAAEAVGLTTDFDGTSKEAMFWKGRVYFLSDRDGVMNVWSMDANGKDLKQHTKHTEFDASSPELDNGRIVYAHAGDVRVLDIASGKDEAVKITLATDLEQMRERWVKEPVKTISRVSVSPNGDRVVITARGRVFVAPAKAGQGRLVEVGTTPGVRYRHAVFSSDGKQIYAANDQTGEVEYWSLPANGVGTTRQITTESKVLRWEGVVSPDGKRLAHSDKDQRLYITEIETGATKEIAQAKPDRPTDYVWAPDSQWLAYVEQGENFAQRIKLYSVASGQTTVLTSDRFESFSPAFTPDGKWLYFLSDRHISSAVPSPWGPMAPQPVFDDRTKVYHVALKAGTRSPWQAKDELQEPKKDEKKDEPKKDEPKKDEEKKEPTPKPDAEVKKDEPKVEPGTAEKKEDGKGDTKPAVKKDEKKDEKKVPEVVIDLEGIQTRLMEVPIKPGNYSRLSVTDGAIYFAENSNTFDREEGGPSGFALKGVSVSNEKVEVKTVASGIKSYELSADKKKIMLYTGTSVSVVDAAPAPAEVEKNVVSLSGWSMSYMPMVEYRQLYRDAWRLLRDYFYATNMHGVDWPAMQAKYAPFVERVRSRAELNEVLAQLTGELSALHHFVRGGDVRDTQDNVALASLGAEWSRQETNGGWTLTRIYQHDTDEPNRAGPLNRAGVDVKVGDTVVAINGRRTLDVPHPAALLRSKVGQQVLLRIRPAGKAEADERDVIVRPVSMATLGELRYSDWEHSRRLMVEKASENTIGYVHLRAMGTENIAEWAKGYFPAFNRAGLIIDVRRNNGGNIDSWILGQLLRKAWMFWNQRVGTSPNWNMQYAFRGHVVVICDSFTASDGEAFSDGFKRLGLGKVIGTRTWGGEIWLSSSNDLADGGLASAGEYGVYVSEGVWIVEGHGVDPDIVVDNLPHATFKGEDAQLKAAIDHLQKLIKEKPVSKPPVPPLPDKSVKDGAGRNNAK